MSSIPTIPSCEWRPATSGWAPTNTISATCAGSGPTSLNDITDVTGEVFLGLSIGCARCHDHKFDPILAKGLLPAPGVFHSALAPRRLDAGHAATVGRVSGETRGLGESGGRHPSPDRCPRTALSRQGNRQRDRQVPRRDQGDPGQARAGSIVAGAAARRPGISSDHLTSTIRYRRCSRGRPKPGGTSCTRRSSATTRLRPVPPDPVLTATDLGPVSPPTVIPGDRKQEPIEPGYLSVLDPAAGPNRAVARGPAIDGAAAGPGSLAEPARQSPFDPRHRQPGLAIPFRAGPGRHVERFRPHGRGTQPSRAARLAGDRICRRRLAASSLCIA